VTSQDVIEFGGWPARRGGCGRSPRLPSWRCWSAWSSPAPGRTTAPLPRRRPQQCQFLAGACRSRRLWHSRPRPRERADRPSTAAGGLGPNPCRCSGEGEPQPSWMLCSALACRWHRPGLARRRRVRRRVQPRRQSAGQRRRRRHRAAVEPGHRPPRPHAAGRSGGPFTCMPARAHLGTRSVSRQARCPLNAP
jgi:hypothetical protein